MPTPSPRNNRTLPPDIRPEAVKSLHHTGVNEWLHMNKWQFLYVIEKMQRKPKAPRLEHVAIPAAFFLALLLAMLPSDFKYYLGINAQVWQSTVLFFTILSALINLVLFIVWFKNSLLNKEKTPEDILKEVIAKMEAEQKKLRT